RRDQADAGCGAALDLMLQAGTRAVAEEGVLALADRKHFLQMAERLADRQRARVRPEIPPRAAAGTAVHGKSRIFLVTAQVNVRIALVVAQQDVVTRPVLLDEVVL